MRLAGKQRVAGFSALRVERSRRRVPYRVALSRYARTGWR
jgi:hypothetical protein